MSHDELTELTVDVSRLTTEIEAEGALILTRWDAAALQGDFAPSATNLAHYLALRHRDLRALQRRLVATGLSSLGRSESRVMPTLQAVARTLAAAAGGPSPDATQTDAIYAGEARIEARSTALLGTPVEHSGVRLLVTLPTEAAADPGFVMRLAQLGVAGVRINCAHDDETVWAAMIAHVDEAARVTGRRMKVMMDLPGPKIRTGALREGKKGLRLWVGDDLALVRPGRLSDAPHKLPGAECTLDQALLAAAPGHRVFIDDGKLSSVVQRCEDWGLVVRIETGPDAKGYKLKVEKGINFPDAHVQVPALTDDDRALLPFIARHADGIEFSFVQTPEDVSDLQAALAVERPEDWATIGLILKIETRLGVQSLPDMLVRAASRQPTAVMIARGDLAVEIGFARLAEIQEEILWLCEAAQVPVIWATQVLESFLKTGIASRGEMTDAAMAGRADCVMLNKGVHLFEAIVMLDQLLDRMSGHMHKKSHLLRPLKSWA